jgi:PAS domain S-box-containing protein
MTAGERSDPIAPFDDPELFRRVFLESVDSIVITDERGRIMAANPAWLSLYGYTIDEIRGRTTSVIKSSHSNADMYRYMWSQISDPAKGYWKGEIVNCRKSGEEIAVLLTITPVRRADSTIAGYVGIGIDVTERHRTEELQEIYSIVVRHDLKAPLSSIVALVGTILDGYVGTITAKQRDILERVQRAGLRMDEMIATSLDIEKMKRGTLRITTAEVDLFESVREAISTLADPAVRKEVTVSLRSGDRLATEDDRLILETDPIHLQRCLENLLKNAIEASPAGRNVGIAIEDRPKEGMVRIRFHNDGPPIPPDVRATLFHAFSTYGKRGGSGLGIFGVKMAVEAMGGAIRYESDEGGTTFDISLPSRGPEKVEKDPTKPL